MGRMLVRFFGHTPGAECVIASHAILGCSGLDSVFMNVGVVFGDAPSGDDRAAARLREFVARIDARGVGGYVCLSEGVQAGLGPLARELGLEPLPPLPLMVRAAGGPATRADVSAGGARFGVETVTTAAGIAEFLAISNAAFDLPPGLYGHVVTPELLAVPGIRISLGRHDGVPVSCVCAVEDEGLVAVTGMATLPEMQGRGVGGRLLAHALGSYEGRARAFYLTASREGRRLYEHAGFEIVDAATAWAVPPPPGATSGVKPSGPGAS
jgi:GNAT superfamily N-acetyltransferase